MSKEEGWLEKPENWQAKRIHELKAALIKAMSLIDKAELMGCALYRKDINELRAIVQEKG